MDESQFGRVQCQPWSSTKVAQRLLEQRLAIDFVAADVVSSFGQMNADLVCPTGFQPAGDHRIAGQLFDRLHMCDGSLADRGESCAAATPIAAVAHQPQVDGLGGNIAMGHCQISSMDRMPAKLLDESPFGQGGAGEHHQPARFAVEAVDGADRNDSGTAIGVPGSGSGRSARWGWGAAAGQDPGDDLVERRLSLLAPLRPEALLAMTQRRHARRLFHHHHVRIDVPDPHVVVARWSRLGLGEQLDDFPFLESPAFVEAQVAVNLKAATANLLADRSPACVGQVSPEKGGQRQARFGRRDVEHLAAVTFHGIGIW